MLFSLHCNQSLLLLLLFGSNFSLLLLSIQLVGVAGVVTFFCCFFDEAFYSTGGSCNIDHCW